METNSKYAITFKAIPGTVAQRNETVNVDADFISEESGYDPEEIAKAKALQVGEALQIDPYQTIRRIAVLLLLAVSVWGCNPYTHLRGHNLYVTGECYPLDADIDLYVRGNKAILTIDGFVYEGIYGVTYLKSGGIEVHVQTLDHLTARTFGPYVPSNY
jgi:hypothetical protein